MSDVAEKCKSAQELQDDLLAIKLRLAFQEDLEEEIEVLSRELRTDPQVLSALNEADARVNINTEDADVRYVEMQGQNALLSEKGSWVTLTWAMSDRFFIVDLQGSAEEAMRIAENVVLIE